MSSSSTPTGAHAASVKKIANYTQSISTGVTNLLTEIARVSASAAPAPVSATGTDAAILLQLQALTGQIVGLVNRMDEVQRMVGGLEKRLDDMGTGPSDIRWELTNHHAHISQNYNDLARMHNGRARKGSSVLIPLHNSHDRPILGFPSTIKHLAFLDEYVRENLCQAFGLKNNRLNDTLEEFIGVRAQTMMSVSMHSLPAETLALERIKRTSEREAACEAAGPATVKTREAAEVHNKEARAHNKELYDGPIIPIHDSRNIPVTGFPATFESLTRPDHQADILYFLREYEQDLDQEEALTQWYRFVGVDTERAWEVTEYENYTWDD